jgi:hypothetical protein
LGLNPDDFVFNPEQSLGYGPAEMMRRRYTAGRGIWEGVAEDEFQKMRAAEGPIAKDAGMSEAKMRATQTLKDKGIAGVKYLDGFSRGAGDGTHNYAIWDDRVLEILKRYGLPLTAGGLATLTALLNEQQETA